MRDKVIYKYPVWICSECGEKHGRRECGIATWHIDTCDVCGETKEVTEPRDFGHLNDTWKKYAKKVQKYSSAST